MAWLHRVKIKHLMPGNEDYDTVQKGMTAIADVLSRAGCFWNFDVSKFRDIPRGDDFFGPADYANILLDKMYNFADTQRIWIE